MMFLYSDAVDFVRDYLGASDQGESLRHARQAVQAVHRELPSLHAWTCYLKHGRINLQAPYTTGTIEYTASTRTLTLTGGTWPAWAAEGTVRVDDVDARVEERSSDTDLILSASLTFLDNISAGTSYTLYKDAYELPADFSRMDRPVQEDGWLAEPISRQTRLWAGRYRESSGSPYAYSIEANPERTGFYVARFFPWPDVTETVDFLYQARPRPLVYDRIDAGSASATASSTTITGSGTAWTTGMIGSYIRFGSDRADPPTDITGTNPYRYEGCITAVASATSLTVEVAPDFTVNNSKLSISDPIEMAETTMRNPYEKGAMAHAAIHRNKSGREIQQTRAEFIQAVRFAAEADARSMAVMVAGN
jgi:hypothetical protein